MALADIYGSGQPKENVAATPLMVQALLRHVMSESVSEGIINCLIVTNSSEANVQLTRLHEHLFARESMLFVLAIWKEPALIQSIPLTDALFFFFVYRTVLRTGPHHADTLSRIG
jgi:hypothetical protein